VVLFPLVRRDGRIAWSGYGIVVWGVLCWWFTSWTFPPVITLFLSIFCIVPLWPATTNAPIFGFCKFYFVTSGHCICILSCGCVGLYVVVTVADLGLCHWKVGYRILNCIIIFWSLILVSNFSLGVSSSFYQSHFCCSYCFIYSFLFGIRCVGCYCDRFLFVGMVHQILRKLGRCQMTQLIKLIIN